MPHDFTQAPANSSRAHAECPVPSAKLLYLLLKSSELYLTKHTTHTNAATAAWVAARLSGSLSMARHVTSCRYGQPRRGQGSITRVRKVKAEAKLVSTVALATCNLGRLRKPCNHGTRYFVMVKDRETSSSAEAESRNHYTKVGRSHDYFVILLALPPQGNRDQGQARLRFPGSAGKHLAEDRFQPTYQEQDDDPGRQCQG